MNRIRVSKTVSLSGALSSKNSLILKKCEVCNKQVEATTEKRPMVRRGNGLFFRDTKCTEITGRHDLTGICAMICQTHVLFYRVC